MGRAAGPRPGLLAAASPQGEEPTATWGLAHSWGEGAHSRGCWQEMAGCHCQLGVWTLCRGLEGLQLLTLWVPEAIRPSRGSQSVLTQPSPSAAVHHSAGPQGVLTVQTLTHAGVSVCLRLTR